MSISRKITEGGSGGSGETYVDDVFSTYLYKGTDANQNIANGVDLSGEGGMVWSKDRSAGYDHGLMDTERGRDGGNLQSNDTNAAQVAPEGKDLTSFNSDGYSIGPKYTGGYNKAGEDYVSWTFRKAPKFFDVVTYVGDGTSDFSHKVPHNLGCQPGLVIFKNVSANSDWLVWTERCWGAGTNLILNETNAEGGANEANGRGYVENGGNYDLTPVATGTGVNANKLNDEYVAYLFAHDDSEEGMIQCGSYTGNGAYLNGPEIDLGWEPQYLLIKSVGSEGWRIADSMRGIAMGTAGAYLSADRTNLEAGSFGVELQATGFKVTSNNADLNSDGIEYIYMAIRRPNKPAEEFEPEELFDVTLTNQDNTAVQTSLSRIDLNIHKTRTDGTYYFAQTRPQGNIKHLRTNDTLGELDYGVNDPRGVFDTQGKVKSYSSNSTVIWSWRRAPGFMDVVTYEGDGTTRNVAHGLTVAPELLIVKRRDSSESWYVTYGTFNAQHLMLDLANGLSTYDVWGGLPTTTTFPVENGAVNNAAGNYIAYLFASVPGISKVGSYTGIGQEQDIDCGFTNGARFVLIKRTDAAGDWMVFDALRGINFNSSPMLKLNKADAESTASSSSIKFHPEGFTCSSGHTSIDGAEYIYMAIA